MTISGEPEVASMRNKDRFKEEGTLFLSYRFHLYAPIEFERSSNSIYNFRSGQHSFYFLGKYSSLLWIFLLDIFHKIDTRKSELSISLIFTDWIRARSIIFLGNYCSLHAYSLWTYFIYIYNTKITLIGRSSTLKLSINHVRKRANQWTIRVEIDKFVWSHECQPGSFVLWRAERIARSLKLSRLVSMNSGCQSTLIDIGGWYTGIYR